MKGGIIIPSKDFITHLLNVTTSDILNYDVRIENETAYYEITLVRKPLTCPRCGSAMIGHGRKQRKINHPAIRDRNGIILYNANRYICKICKKTEFEPNPFAMDGFNSSYLLLQSIMKMLKNLNYTLQMISNELNISTTQVLKYIDSYITIPPRTLPENLGIDEIHSPALSRKNSSYLCIIVNNEKRQLYDILDTRSKEPLSLYFSKFPREQRLNVKYVTIDMWEPYKDVVKVYFPNCIVAVDPFHVIKHLTTGFDNLRISLMKQCIYDSNGYYLLKKWSWLLKTDNVELDNERKYNRRFNRTMSRRDILSTIFDSFPILKQAYDLKEEYRYINKNCSYEEALSRFKDIRKKFKDAKITQYDEFTSILFNWEEEILNSFHRPQNSRRLSNSFTENINGKIKLYIAQSKGIQNFERFRKRVIYALSDDIYFAISSNLITLKEEKRKRGPYRKSTTNDKNE